MAGGPQIAPEAGFGFYGMPAALEARAHSAPALLRSDACPEDASRRLAWQL